MAGKVTVEGLAQCVLRVQVTASEDTLPSRAIKGEPYLEGGERHKGGFGCKSTPLSHWPCDDFDVSGDGVSRIPLRGFSLPADFLGLGDR
jgi:hypothetical protein